MTSNIEPATPRQPRARDGGFTLVEVLVSMLLLAFGLIAVVPMFVQATQENAAGGDFGWLAAAGEERMELLRGVAFGTLAAGGSLTADAAGYFDEPRPDAVVRWTVSDNVSPANTKTITLLALERGTEPGPRREIRLVSLRAQ